MPAPGALDLNGLDLTAETMEELMRIDVGAWRAEADGIEAYFATYDRLPGELLQELASLRSRLS